MRVLSNFRLTVQTPRLSYAGLDLGHARVLAQRPLVSAILADYGNPATDEGRVSALRDWVARTALHGLPDLTPAGSSANLAVLPAGKTWADANAAANAAGKVAGDDSVNNAAAGDGTVLLDKLIGTVNVADGSRAPDGRMTKQAGGQAYYRVNSLATYVWHRCTYQHRILQVLLGAAGYHGALCSTVGHDPLAVWVPALRGWVYACSTYNELFRDVAVGEPLLGPVELHTLSRTNQRARATPAKRPGPLWSPEVFIDPANPNSTYFTPAHPDGMAVMGASGLDQRYVGGAPRERRLVQIDAPALAGTAGLNDQRNYARVAPGTAFPNLGVAMLTPRSIGAAVQVPLISSWPNHDHFERQNADGTVVTVPASDVVMAGAGVLAYRSVDTAGTTSGWSSVLV